MKETDPVARVIKEHEPVVGLSRIYSVRIICKGRRLALWKCVPETLPERYVIQVDKRNLGAANAIGKFPWKCVNM